MYLIKHISQFNCPLIHSIINININMHALLNFQSTFQPTGYTCIVKPSEAFIFRASDGFTIQE